MIIPEFELFRRHQSICGLQPNYNVRHFLNVTSNQTTTVPTKYRLTVSERLTLSTRVSEMIEMTVVGRKGDKYFVFSIQTNCCQLP